MKKIVAGFIALILVLLVATSAYSAVVEKYGLQYRGINKTVLDGHIGSWYNYVFGVFTGGTLSRFDIKSGEALMIFDKTTVTANNITKTPSFEFAKFEVLNDYKIQTYIKKYDNSTGIKGEWVKAGDTFTVTDVHISGTHTIGPVIFDIEQEDTDGVQGVEIHSYYASVEGTTQYDKVKTDFETQYKKVLANSTVPPIEPCKTIPQCLAQIDAKLVSDLKLAK